MALLRAARAYAPQAWLVYKPHPDVVARLRRPGADEANARALCDEMVLDAPMDSLLRQIDELHVMTSLSGFEALLRGCPVVVHGQPFYAGWGLTTDLDPPPRRGRALCLDALVAATLISYPSYVSRITGRFTTPERALDEIQQWRADSAARQSVWLRRWRQIKRFLLHFVAFNKM
jgi:capsular polysaccharide export protein